MAPDASCLQPTVKPAFLMVIFPPSLRVVGSNAACLALCRVEYAAGHNRWAEDLQHLAAHIAQSLKDFPIINPATVKAITNTQM